MQIKNEYKLKCVKCGKEYTVYCSENNFEKGKYRKTCSSSCANRHLVTDDTKNKIRNGVLKYLENQNKTVYIYKCEKCKKDFISNKKLRKDRYIHCDECKRNSPHFKDNILSIKNLSSRTISKILKRANKSCSICNWNESTCDIHHIIPVKNGGSNLSNNLIIVCPNCHRVIHTTNKYSIEFLQSLSVEKTFSNWKYYYHPSN